VIRDDATEPSRIASAFPYKPRLSRTAGSTSYDSVMRPVRVALLAVALSASTLCAADHYDLLVEGAVDFELAPLLESLQGKQQIQIGSWTYWTGRMGTRSVVIARTEQGPINAAASTALAINAFHPAAIIDQGTAGAHNPDYHVFDIVLGETTTDYSGYQSSHKDAGAGIDVTQWTPMPHKLRIDGQESKAFARFPGDRSLLAAARASGYSRGKLHVGNIGSAYAFNRQVDFARWARQTYGTDSEDMESAYAGGVAAGMRVPFLAIRIISNSEYNHPAFERVSGTWCAQFVADLIRSLK
jgi:adenosylhomocysteine nucleosidase